MHRNRDIQMKEETDMTKRLEVYKCELCGNIVEVLHASGGELVCCGQPMKLLEEKTADAATEKHVPVIKVEGDKAIVHVGSVDHPMLAEHFIEWIYLQTEEGGQRKCLQPGGAPEAVFALGGAKVVAAYAYCNLHGLWKANA